MKRFFAIAISLRATRTCGESDYGRPKEWQDRGVTTITKRHRSGEDHFE